MATIIQFPRKLSPHGLESCVDDRVSAALAQNLQVFETITALHHQLQVTLAAIRAYQKEAEGQSHYVE